MPADGKVRLSTRGAISRMVDRSGMTRTEVGAALGHKRAYITTLLGMPSAQTVTTIQRIAAVCGYELVLRSDSDEFVLVEKEKNGE